MENVCIKEDQQFMCRAILGDDTYIDEFIKGENGEVKETNIYDIINKPDISQFGLVGEGHYLYLDPSNGSFNVLQNKIDVKMIDEDGNDMLAIKEKIDKFIMFRTHRQFLVSENNIIDVLARYTFGYKLKTDKLNAKVSIAIDKDKGVLCIVDICVKKDTPASFQIHANNTLYAVKDAVFKTNETFNLELKLF